MFSSQYVSALGWSIQQPMEPPQSGPSTTLALSRFSAEALYQYSISSLEWRPKVPSWYVRITLELRATIAQRNHRRTGHILQCGDGEQVASGSGSGLVQGVCVWLIRWEPVLIRSILRIVSTTPNILTIVPATSQSIVPAVQSSRLKLINIANQLIRK